MSKDKKHQKSDKLGYEEELRLLQIELLKFQNHVKDKGLRVLMLMEGRDAAGKGGTIKRLTEHLNPRGCRIVALTKPSDVEKTQWYFQRSRSRQRLADVSHIFENTTASSRRHLAL